MSYLGLGIQAMASGAEKGVESDSIAMLSCWRDELMQGSELWDKRQGALGRAIRKKWGGSSY